jgi:hypothetical protein
MNDLQRRERFTELMTTIELLGSPDDEGYDPKFPQGTLGLSDGGIKTAIVAQAMREDDEFVGNLINALANTGFGACQDKHEHDQSPSDDDLSAVTLAIHVAWAKGAFMPMAFLMGTFAKLIDVMDVEIPDDLTLILRSNHGVKEKAQLVDPIALLDMSLPDLKEYLAEALESDS